MNTTQAKATLASAIPEPHLNGLAWARSARTLWLLIAGVVVFRILAIVLLHPAQLVADEAHYWEWSRRPALSYYSKGPGVAWAIGASTAILGTTESWHIRMPAVIASGIAMIALAAAGFYSSGRDMRVAVAAALCFAAAPVFQGMALLMTIDGPLLACWAMAVWAGWAMLRRWSRGEAAMGPAVGLAAALGVGFLFKYTIGLLIPGMVVFVILWRREIRWRRAMIGEVAAALIVFLIAISPVILWNAQSGWPTVKHLLGALQLPGGDRPVAAPTGSSGGSYNPLWTLELIGAQVGGLGPALFLLIILASLRSWRNRRQNTTFDGWTTDAYLLACGLPVIVFYLAITFTHRAQANWPIAGWVSMLVIVARAIPDEMTRFNQMLAHWLALPADHRPKAGFLRKMPETLFQVAWHWTLAIGIGSAIVLASIKMVAMVPGIGSFVPVSRIAGQVDEARRMDAVRQSLGDEGLLLMADKYQTAGLAAFYMQGQPRVFCGQRYLGSRATQYDYFTDTDLSDPALIGRSFLLIGADHDRWADGFRFESIREVDVGASAGAGAGAGGAASWGRVWIGSGYGGPVKRFGSAAADDGADGSKP